MFGRRRNAGDRDAGHRDAVAETAVDLAAEAGAVEPFPGDEAPPAGPWDVTEPYPEAQRVDLGSLQVPVLAGTDIQLVFAEQHGAWVTVRHGLSELQLQAFAAPKSDSLWDDVRTEIAAEVTGNGGMATERSGPFGAELLARIAAQPGQPAGQPQPGAQLVRFTGVDGPRWFLRGVFSGAAADDPAAAAPLEAVMRDVVVVRGDHPVPPRDLLELRLPPEAAAALEEQARAQQEQEGQAQEPQQVNRFTAQPNPFERGPEFTETR